MKYNQTRIFTRIHFVASKCESSCRLDTSVSMGTGMLVVVQENTHEIGSHQMVTFGNGRCHVSQVLDHTDQPIAVTETVLSVEELYG